MAWRREECQPEAGKGEAGKEADHLKTTSCKSPIACWCGSLDSWAVFPGDVSWRVRVSRENGYMHWQRGWLERGLLGGWRRKREREKERPVKKEGESEHAVAAFSLESTLMSEQANLEREEFLDDQDPLRHLRSPDADDVLVPVQPPSILSQRTDLLIPALDPGHPGITVKLALDAAPGCGGIAWPAGEASSLFYHARVGETLIVRPGFASDDDDHRSSAHTCSNEVPSKTKQSLSWAVERVSSVS